MQTVGGIFAELACVFFLSSLTSTIDIIIKFIALGSIAKVDDFYAAAIPSISPIKKLDIKFPIKNRNREITSRSRN